MDDLTDADVRMIDVAAEAGRILAVGLEAQGLHAGHIIAGYVEAIVAVILLAPEPLQVKTMQAFVQGVQEAFARQRAEQRRGDPRAN